MLAHIRHRVQPTSSFVNTSTVRQVCGAYGGRVSGIPQNELAEAPQAEARYQQAAARAAHRKCRGVYWNDTVTRPSCQRRQTVCVAFIQFQYMTSCDGINCGDMEVACRFLYSSIHFAVSTSYPPRIATSPKLSVDSFGGFTLSTAPTLGCYERMTPLYSPEGDDLSGNVCFKASPPVDNHQLNHSARGAGTYSITSACARYTVIR